MDNPAATQPDISQMSDDEIMAMSAPPAVVEVISDAASSGSQSTEITTEEQTAAVEPNTTTTSTTEEEVEGDESTNKVDQKTGKDPVKDAKVAGNEVDNKGDASATSGKETQTTTEQTQEQKKDVTTSAKPEAEAVDHKAFYEAIVKPFKANGKMVAPKNAEEAIQLMQMGANYTRKMQDLAPYRKAGMMLENNGLLDDGKLSYLIDLHNKNPEAIKKLIQESGYDVMNHDPEEKVNYQPNGNHIVSDVQVALKSALEDVASTDEGRQTLQEINTTWDQASKDLLFTNPDLVKVINDQRANGVYQKITDEINHRRTLGQIGNGVSFLQAYRSVGDELQARGAFGAPVKQDEPAAKPDPIAVRAEKPKPQVDNADQVAAAATTRTNGKPAKVTRNPLEMSDAEFMKQFDNR